jgi:hypothetical protein
MHKCIHRVAAGLLVLALQVTGRAGDPEATALVNRAIKASGGAGKVAALKAGACKARASVQEGGIQIAMTFDVTWQGWDQYRVSASADIGGMAKNLLLVINGDKAWAKDLDNNQVKPAPPGAVPMITGTLYSMRMPHMLSALLDKEVKLTPLGETKIDDRAALGVTVGHKDRKDVSLYFDKETGLPAKSEIRLTEPNGMEKTFAFHYHDFKEDAGLKHPTRVLIKADNVTVTVDVSDVKAKDKVEANLFAAPE